MFSIILDYFIIICFSSAFGGREVGLEEAVHSDVCYWIHLNALIVFRHWMLLSLTLSCYYLYTK